MLVNLIYRFTVACSRSIYKVYSALHIFCCFKTFLYGSNCRLRSLYYRTHRSTKFICTFCFLFCKVADGMNCFYHFVGSLLCFKSSFVLSNHSIINILYKSCVFCNIIANSLESSTGRNNSFYTGTSFFHHLSSYPFLRLRRG